MQLRGKSCDLNQCLRMDQYPNRFSVSLMRAIVRKQMNTAPFQIVCVFFFYKT